MEPGIYFEAKPVFGLPILGYHGYLVYRDGMGTVEVIRGGTSWYKPFFLGETSLSKAEFHCIVLKTNIPNLGSCPRTVIERTSILATSLPIN